MTTKEVDKSLNNVQKVKLENFLNGKAREVRDAIRNEYHKNQQVIVKKLEANTPAKVTALYKQYKEAKSKKFEFDKLESKLERDLAKEGYSVSTYDDYDLKISNTDNRPEVKALEVKHDKKAKELENLLELAVLRVWTGNQSEVMGIIDEMVKAMQKITKS